MRSLRFAFTAESHHPGDAESIVAGTDERLNAMGMPSIAMWMQCGLVMSSSCWFRLVAVPHRRSLTSDADGERVYDASLPVPHAGFPFFKARQDLDRPFVIFKTRMWQ